MVQKVKNPPTMQEMQVQSSDQEDPLEEEIATHSGYAMSVDSFMLLQVAIVNSYIYIYM